MTISQSEYTVNTNKITKEDYASYGILFSLILGAFLFKLFPIVIAGMATYAVSQSLYNFFSIRMKGDASRITILIVVSISLIMLTAAGVGIYFAIRAGHGASRILELEQDVYNILIQIKNYLPTSFSSFIPENFFELKGQIVEMAKQSSGKILTVTTTSAKLFLYIFIGFILGAMVSFTVLQKQAARINSTKLSTDINKPFVESLLTRINIFADVFCKVIVAQVQISIVNTILTAIYLFVILPIFSIKIPYSGTILLLTFLLGLIPILGNLIVNSIVVIVSLTVSFKVAILSLIFLMVIHKLEYYINARVVGGKLKIYIWEMLIAMVFLEAIFGPIGVVLAPALYGYIKEELKNKGII